MTRAGAEAREQGGLNDTDRTSLLTGKPGLGQEDMRKYGHPKKLR